MCTILKPENNRALSVPAAESLFWDLAAGHPLLRVLLGVRRRRLLAAWTAAGTIFVGFTALSFMSCYVEQTLWLPPPDRGLLQHYGTMANLAGSPLLLILTLLLLKRSAQAVDRYTESGTGSGSFPRLSYGVHDRLVEVLSFRSVLSVTLLSLMVLVGGLGLVMNILNTRHPVTTYGQNVWDASQYTGGYIVGRLLLAFEWLIVLPLAGYFTIVSVLAVTTIVAGYTRGDRRNLRPLDADGCGGFRLLGQVVLHVVYVLAVVGAILVAHVITHRNFYDTLGLAIGVFVVSVGVLFVPFLQLHRLLAEAKESLLRSLGEEMWSYQVALEDAQNKAAALIPAVSLLAQNSVYQRASALRTWPYLPVDRIKWLVPLLPALVGLVLREQGMQ
jgi:hypothetical protein